MKRVCLGCLIWLSLAATARAAGEWFVLHDERGWASNAPNHPAAQKLKQLEEGKQSVKSVAISRGGDWVLLEGGSGFVTDNDNLPVCKKLAELHAGHALKCVAFAPEGGSAIFWDRNGFWTQGAVPEGAVKKMQEIAKSGGALRSVAFARNGGWVLLHDESGVAYGDIAPDLAKQLTDLAQRKEAIHCVALNNAGDWIVLAANSWWTSDLDLPASKRIATLAKAGKQQKWVAFSPQFAEHNFGRWSELIHQEYDGKLAGGYAFEVRHGGKVVAEGAEGWARAPWEKQQPSVKWTLEKPMGVASVSKTVTAVALLKLWEESGRRFSLDDPFWPHIQRVCPTAHADVKRVTIRQLLMHRSGLKKADDVTKLKDLEKLLNEPLAHKPGEVEEYQNNNFYILHVVIEEIGHVQYTPYVKEHVLKPMGIARMETHFEPRQPTCGYGKAGDKKPGYPFDWNTESWAGAAGWYASAADLGRFLTGLRDHRVLNLQTTEEMYRNNFGWDSSRPGWTKGGLWVWDEGSRAGSFRSAIAHFSDDVDAVILANCETPVDVQDLVVKAWKETREKPAELRAP